MQESRAYRSAEDLMDLERLIDEKTAEFGRRLYRTNIQKVADALPRTGSDGKPLREGRTVKSGILTPYGLVEPKLFCGRCQTSGKFECPFKVVFCRGESRALSPLPDTKASGRLTRSTRRHEDTEVFLGLRRVGKSPSKLSVPPSLRHLRVNRPEALSEARKSTPLDFNGEKIL